LRSIFDLGGDEMNIEEKKKEKPKRRKKRQMRVERENLPCFNFW